ncbi:hypothetical protein CBR_g27749 [Chara braunii]|uniref:Uncharacterized protein n=1 Tax=Chara braunii TaxID=69332 RepID=A0A388L8B5_CHABU|nr:hypothetical protein CBR_g27749 [Chara braunii]|eukprot:GBG78524.1 hypothetical protein CBR_g27749 [Chara braunii]
MGLQNLRMGLLCGCVTFLCLRGVVFEWIHRIHTGDLQGTGGAGVYDRRMMDFRDERLQNAVANFQVDDRADTGRFKLLWVTAEPHQPVKVENKDELLQHMLGERRVGGQGVAGVGGIDVRYRLRTGAVKELTTMAAELGGEKGGE